MVRTAPQLSTADAERLARELYGIEASAERLPSERDANFALTDASGNRFVLKVANREDRREILDMQNEAISRLRSAATGLQWPGIAGELACRDGHLIRLLTWIDGVCFAEIQQHPEQLLESLGRALAEMDVVLAIFDHPAAHRVFHWDLRRADLAREHASRLSVAQRALVDPIFEEWARIDWSRLPASVIHGDANDYNVLVDEAASRVVSVLDFGDMVYSATVGNLAVGIAYAMLDKQDPIAAAACVARGYHAVRPLSQPEVDALYTLVRTRLAMSVCYCAWQAGEAPQNEYLSISNRPAWALLEQLAAFPEGWPEEVLGRACNSIQARDPGDLLAARRRGLGPSLSISYREPLHIIRGWRQHLYESRGRRYLDCVNNVAHVGHSHPRVVEAAARQMRLLNTNTRYLDEQLVDYIERLTSTLPDPLNVVYLVCSGSEANELALRLARAHTGRDGVIVVETAYHGNTNALIDISPYKFDGPGGRGCPRHVQVVPMPDRYRGLYREPDSGPRYAGFVAEAARREPPAAFFCESALSCAGQVILPDGYLREAFTAVREAGGICVSDEVQTGFGRAGTHFWMFETQGVVPDVVTMGKPIGNGHPMGAVVTTAAVAASFANGMEYFNTFGGNPVSCAAGLAVLDVIRDEGLQENARRTGDYLLAGLRDLATHKQLIGDVRGTGLFLGFELVRSRKSLEPAAEEASSLVNRMKELGVLLSTDGPLHNVIKIKPPLVFARSDADRVLQLLDAVL